MPVSNRLWAPWRSRYLTRKQSSGCFLCKAARSKQDRQNHVILRGKRIFALLNRYPYNNGHLLVAPYRHIGRLSAITSLEWMELLPVSQTLIGRLKKEIRPHGFNLGVNSGRGAGAGVPGHFHLHIVPRWRGDTNFMPVIGGTKVIAQSLDELYRLICKEKT